MTAPKLPRYAVCASSNPALEQGYPQRRCETLEEAEAARVDLLQRTSWMPEQVVVRENVPESYDERRVRQDRERNQFLAGLKVGDSVCVKTSGRSYSSFLGATVRRLTASSIFVTQGGREVRFVRETGQEYGASCSWRGPNWLVSVDAEEVLAFREEESRKVLEGKVGVLLAKKPSKAVLEAVLKVLEGGAS